MYGEFYEHILSCGGFIHVGISNKYIAVPRQDSNIYMHMS